jgi:hypothetical protein
MAGEQNHRDPQSPDWENLAWSPWQHLDAAAEYGLVPRKQGVYRLRCRGHPTLIYVGISDRLSSRLGGLRRARSHPPQYRGHSAAACVAGHEAQGKVVEVSWAVLEGLDRRALMGIEVDLIAACRMRFGYRQKHRGSQGHAQNSQPVAARSHSHIGRTSGWQRFRTQPDAASRPDGAGVHPQRDHSSACDRTCLTGGVADLCATRGRSGR